MVRIDESGTQLAAAGACLVDLRVCLDPVCINLGRISHRIDKRGLGLGESGFKIFSSGLRLGEGGPKLFSFGHDLCRSIVRPFDCVYDLSGAGGEIPF